jgi:hypothetical protein
LETNSKLLKELERVVGDRELLRKKLASYIKQAQINSSTTTPGKSNISNEILTERRARESLQREVFALREQLSKSKASKDALAQRVLQLEHAQLRAMARPQSSAAAVYTLGAPLSARSFTTDVAAKMPDDVAAVLAVEPLVLKL